MSRERSHIDWRLIVLKLSRAVGSQRKVAQLLGVSESCLRGFTMEDTAYPRFDTGVRLLKAYSDHVAPIEGIDAVVRLMEGK